MYHIGMFAFQAYIKQKYILNTLFVNIYHSMYINNNMVSMSVCTIHTNTSTLHQTMKMIILIKILYMVNLTVPHYKNALGGGNLMRFITYMYTHTTFLKCGLHNNVNESIFIILLYQSKR